VDAVVAADGVVVPVVDRGAGPAILIVHEGFDDGTSYRMVAWFLARRYRVIRYRRRPYRLDLRAERRQGVAGEVADIRAIAEAVPGPLVLFGHSSGGDIALEALAALPGRFAGAVVYEPAIVADGTPLLRRETDAAQRRAFDAGRPAEALTIHMREHVGFGAAYAWCVGRLAVWPHYRDLVEGLVAYDAAGIVAAGDRRAVFETITAPVLLVGGARSPANMAGWLDDLESRLPVVQRVTLRGQGHNAHMARPWTVARLIGGHAQAVLA
jgi:pimeloyl-ACP methyl ester carboxylesterase